MHLNTVLNPANVKADFPPCPDRRDALSYFGGHEYDYVPQAHEMGRGGGRIGEFFDMGRSK
jgi:hypothetical protein